jgi:hypothetical protein
MAGVAFQGSKSLVGAERSAHAGLAQSTDCPQNAWKPGQGGGREMKRVVEFSVFQTAARPTERS